jgi:uncharacterized membrane protein YphA (DoxX/SURF4 family)
MTHLAQSLQLTLGAVFLIAGAVKLRRPDSFVQSVRAYDVLPPRFAGPVAGVLIVLELLIGIALVTGHRTSLAIPAAIGILAAFCVGVIVTLKRGRRIPCGCFGDSDEPISPRSAARLVMLVTSASMLFLLEHAGTRTYQLTLATVHGVAAFTQVVEIAIGACLIILAGLWALNLVPVISLARNVLPKRKAHLKSSAFEGN